MHLLVFRFVPRIRDLADKAAVRTWQAVGLPALSALYGRTLNTRIVRAHGDETLRLGVLI